MNTAHLTEAQLQLYADDMEAISLNLREHVTHCPHCQVKLENYRLMNSALKAMPTPAFDFDLAEQVLASIPAKKTPVAWVPLLAAITGVLLIVIMTSLYTRQIVALFSALPKMWGYALTVPALVLLLTQLTVSVTEHQRKMHVLLGK